MKKVAIVMGSTSDLPIANKAAEVLEKLGIPYQKHVLSAHRTPDATTQFACTAREQGYGVIIAIAGMAAHLAGVIAANTLLPVIGVPVKSAALEGLDALLSTVMMPQGIPVATVALDGGANAAYLAARTLALEDSTLYASLEEARLLSQNKVLADNEQVKNTTLK